MACCVDCEASSGVIFPSATIFANHFSVTHTDFGPDAVVVVISIRLPKSRSIKPVSKFMIRLLVAADSLRIDVEEFVAEEQRSEKCGPKLSISKASKRRDSLLRIVYETLQ